MGKFRDWLTGAQQAAPEPATEHRDAVPLGDERLVQFFVGNEAYTVTESTATACVAVLACLRVRAETFAAMGCHVYRRRPDGGSDRVDDALSRLLTRSPNEHMTPYELWCWKQEQEDVHGNAYVWMQRRDGQVKALWPLDATRMQVKHAGGGLLYRWQGDDDVPAQDFHPHDILHFKGSVLKDSYEGDSLVRLTRETLKLGKEAEAFFGKLLTNGAHFPAYFETDSGTNRQAIEDLREQLDQTSGVLEAGRTRVFGPGLHLKQNPMTLTEMDFSPQLRWNLEQVSRIWRVPLPLLNDLTHGTYTNSEQASLWLSQYTVAPIVTGTEQVLNKRLLPTTQYAKFNMAQLQRGDYNTRTNGYARMVNAGIMTRNEARILEEMNPLEGLDKPLISLASGTVDASGDIQNPNLLDPVADDARSRIRARYLRDGDTERSRKYFEMVAAPVVESMAAAGMDTTLDDFIKEAIDG